MWAKGCPTLWQSLSYAHLNPLSPPLTVMGVLGRHIIHVAKKREKNPSLQESWHLGKEKRKNRRETSREHVAEEKKVVPTLRTIMAAQTGT